MHSCHWYSITLCGAGLFQSLSDFFGYLTKEVRDGVGEEGFLSMILMMQGSKAVFFIAFFFMA
jgi:hypothetical protein